MLASCGHDSAAPAQYLVIKLRGARQTPLVCRTFADGFCMKRIASRAYAAWALLRSGGTSIRLLPRHSFIGPVNYAVRLPTRHRVSGQDHKIALRSRRVLLKSHVVRDILPAFWLPLSNRRYGETALLLTTRASINCDSPLVIPNSLP